MKTVAIVITLLTVCPFLAADEPIRERIEWIDIWVTDADKNDRPRVLFVGDSITRGYFGAVEKQLDGQAYCARLATSKCVSDPTFNDDLLLLLKQYDFSVIHFNNGLHGWGYSEEQYRAGLAATVAAIKKQSPETQLIWATTTPVRDKTNLNNFAEQTDRVQARNKFAAKIMKEHAATTDDLYELVHDHADWESTDGVHFNAKGNAALAKQVAETVLKFLPSNKVK